MADGSLLTNPVVKWTAHRADTLQRSMAKPICWSQETKTS